MKKSLFLLAVIFIAGCGKNNDPLITLTSPAQDAVFEIGDTVIISADAIDEDGTVSEVRFYVNDKGTESDRDFPYEYAWKTLGLERGAYVLKAMALDNEGGSSEEVRSITLVASGSLPIAGFSSDVTNIMEGDTVRFSDLTTNNPKSWNWDFGDGDSSTEQHPVKVYETAGTYTVSLEVSNTYGSDLREISDYIIVSEFCTGCDTSSVEDVDGNSYKTVKIGHQWWMAENLNATHYSNGDTIRFFADSSTMWTSTEPGYTYYQYDEATYADKHGALYNWWAAVESRNICQDGWHVPTPADWEALILNLGGADVAGPKLKSTGGEWSYDNENNTNESGFNALPSGSTEGLTQGHFAAYWTTEEENNSYAYNRALLSYTHNFRKSSNQKNIGYSIRCIKDGGK